MIVRLTVFLCLLVPAMAAADTDLASVQRAFDTWRSAARNLPVTPEGQLRKFLVDEHPNRLSYDDAVALARRIDALPRRSMAVPPFGRVGYERARDQRDVARIRARTNALIAEIQAGRTTARAALPELKRLRAAAQAIDTGKPAVPQISIRVTPRSTVTTTPCTSRGTTVRSLFNLADAVRQAQQTVNLRERPRNISELLQVLSGTAVGRRLLAGQRNLRIAPLTAAERRRRRLGADTQGVFVHGENAIFIRTDQEMGRVLLSLVQELAHMRDATLRRELAEFARVKARAEALGSGAEYDRLVRQLNVMAHRSNYRRELHAWRVETEFVNELRRTYPGFGRYYDALVANELANGLPPTGDDIIRIYELDADIIRAYLRD